MNARVAALVLKELRQILRDRRLVMSLVVPPVIQILLFGFALNPEVKDLRLAVVDESRSAESRELISTMTENRSLRFAGTYPNASALQKAIGKGAVDVGVIVPVDFARQRVRHEDAPVQVIVNAVNANTAQHAQGHVEAAVAYLNQRPGSAGPVEVRTAFLYNPGLVATWFTVSGVLGALITLNGSLVAATAMIREKERGTVEQLLMTPASSLQVVAAKTIPLFVLLMGMTGLGLAVAKIAFDIPFRGRVLLLMAACACCVLTGIGIGTFASTLARTSTQAQLMLFFVNPPLMALSGAFTPIEAMPEWIRPFTWLNPIAYFATIARNVLVKGAGLDVVGPSLLALAVIATLLMTISARRFRTQMR